MARTVAQLDQIVTALVDQAREESTQSITDVQFETGVTDADAVFLDTNFNTWRRSIVGDVNAPEREIFHGVAVINDAGSAVQIYGFRSSDDFVIYEDDLDEKRETFIPGEFVYVSKKALGAFTQTPNEIQAGVAVGADRFLLSSELDNATTALRNIINLARLQTLVDVTDEQKASGYEWPSLQARLDGNYSQIIESDANIAALVLELATAYGAYNSLDSRFNAVESSSDANAAQLQVSAGTAQTLAARLAVGMNEDGSLKAAVSASTYTTETEDLTRIGSNSFSIVGDKTGVYLPRRTVRINDVTIAHVNFSALSDGITIITLVESVIPVTLSKIEYSFDPSELPIIRHTDLTEVRTVDPTSADTVRTKHVSNNDLLTLSTGIATNATDIDTVEAELATFGTAVTFDAGTNDMNLATNYAVGLTIDAAIEALGLQSGATTTVGTAATYNVGTSSTQLTTNTQATAIATSIADAQVSAASLTYTTTTQSAMNAQTVTMSAPAGYQFLYTNCRLKTINTAGSSITVTNDTGVLFTIIAVWVKHA